MRWTIFTACALLATQVQAIGLGPIEVSSHLNERFAARIPVTGASARHNEELVVALASPEQFRKAGIERPFVLALLQFEVVPGENGPQFVRVTSMQPIREPALQFLLAAESPEGTLLQDYAVLLDPAPGVGRPAASPATLPAVDAVPVAPAPAPGGPAAADAPAPPPATPAAAVEDPGSYGPVTETDTLWSLGERLRPDDSVSVFQMMVALKRANPEAFAGDRYDGLRRGVTLRIPPTGDVRAVSAEAALSEVQGALGR